MFRTLLPHPPLWCAALLLAGAAAQAQTVTVQRLDNVLVYGLSNDGQAATGQDFNYETFRWTPATGVVMLGRNPVPTLGVGGGVPRISGDGKVIASTMLSDDGTYATSGRWTVDGGWRQLTPPLPPYGGIMDASDSTVFGLSNDGNTVTGLFWRPAAPGGSAHAMAWTAATAMQDMGSSGAASRIDGASADGSVLAGWDENPNFGNRRATVWVKGAKTLLADGEDGYGSEATAVNNRGNLVVGFAPDALKRTTATLWRRIGNQWLRKSLGVVPGNKRGGYAGALGTSDDGSIVVGYSRPDPLQFSMVGFVWTADGGMVTADSYFASLGVVLDGVVISQVTAVSPDGKSMAAIGATTKPPFVTSSFIIRRAD